MSVKMQMKKWAEEEQVLSATLWSPLGTKTLYTPATFITAIKEN